MRDADRDRAMRVAEFGHALFFDPLLSGDRNVRGGHGDAAEGEHEEDQPDEVAAAPRGASGARGAGGPASGLGLRAGLLGRLGGPGLIMYTVAAL